MTLSNGLRGTRKNRLTGGIEREGDIALFTQAKDYGQRGHTPFKFVQEFYSRIKVS